MSQLAVLAVKKTHYIHQMYVGHRGWTEEVCSQYEVSPLGFVFRFGSYLHTYLSWYDTQSTF